jgi:hypothetical protein
LGSFILFLSCAVGCAASAWLREAKARGKAEKTTVPSTGLKNSLRFNPTILGEIIPFILQIFLERRRLDIRKRPRDFALGLKIS